MSLAEMCWGLSTSQSIRLPRAHSRDIPSHPQPGAGCLLCHYTYVLVLLVCLVTAGLLCHAYSWPSLQPGDGHLAAGPWCAPETLTAVRVPSSTPVWGMAGSCHRQGWMHLHCHVAGAHVWAAGCPDRGLYGSAGLVSAAREGSS